MEINEEKKKAVKYLNTAKGQIEGITKMIENGRYCIDISNQVLAASALLKKANLLILRQHLSHCVLNAFDQEELNQKIDEISQVLGKLLDC